MKTIKISLLALLSVLLFSCDKNDENEVQPIDVKAALVDKVWSFYNITGKVNNGNVNGEVTILKDGKNQHAFASDLSLTTYQFGQNGKAWINSEEFEWELSSDNKTILIGDIGKEKDLKLEVVSIGQNELKIFQKGWVELVADNTLTNSLVVSMDVTITLTGTAIDLSFLTVKNKLAGKTWKYQTISGKLIGGKVKDDITIFKEGKNQYALDNDLSMSTFVFKENGDVEVAVTSISFHSTQTSFLKWGITGDNRKIRMWQEKDPEWILREWEIRSVKDNEITIFERDWDIWVTDKTLTDSFGIKIDAVAVIVTK